MNNDPGWRREPDGEKPDACRIGNEQFDVASRCASH